MKDLQQVYAAVDEQAALSAFEEADLHYKYHRGLQPTAAEGDQIRIPDGRQAAENAVPGDDGYNEKVDRQTAGARCNSFQTADILCRQDSRIVEAGRP